MTRFPYTLTGPIGTSATLGLIVLQVDETIEQDFRRLFPVPEVALYVSRIPSGADLTPETIAAMEAALPRAASLLPATAPFGAVAYACTSGTAQIGPGRVAELVAGSTTAKAVTDPLTAAIAALTALGAHSVALVTPYIEPVARPIRAAFEAASFSVPATLSFGEEVEARVARIDPASIRAAVLEVGRRPGIDAVFVSCTNLRTLDVIDEAEAALGLPVVSSNLALAWHMARMSRAPLTERAPGRLMRP